MLAPAEESLRRRAAANGRVCPTVLRCGVSSWVAYLLQLEWIPLRLGDAYWVVRHDAVWTESGAVYVCFVVREHS